MVHTYFEFIHHSHFVCLKFKEFIFVWIGLKLKKIILMKRELTIGKLYHIPSLIQLLNWDKQRKQIKYIFKISFTLFLLWLLSLWNCIDLPKKKPSYMLIIQNTEKIEEGEFWQYIVERNFVSSRVLTLCCVGLRSWGPPYSKVS